MGWENYWSATWWGPGVELRVYQRTAPSTLIGAVEQRWDVGWLDELTEVGSGQFTIAHDAPAVVANPAILDAGNIVRIHDLSTQTDRFAWTIKQKRRSRGDSHDEVKVFGPGVLDILRYADVYPEYWPSELVADTRMFGFMSSDYTEDASWVTPVARGTQGSRPFGDTRPEGWSDSAAEFIADSTIAENKQGWFWLRAQLVVPERMDVRFEATADEAFELYVAGIPLLNSALDGEYQWATTYHKTLELPAGTYQVAAKVWHPDRPNNGATNLRWFIFSAMAAGESGAPAARNEVQHVHNNATAGNMSLTFAGETTANFAYNATAQTVEDALNALETVTEAGGVDVTGAGTAADPWIVTFRGYGNQPQMTGTGDGTFNGTITITEQVDGSLPDTLLRSNTTSWKVLPLGSPEPGMTPGEILQVLISGAQSRGWAPSVTYDFTAAADSDGTAWQKIEFAAQVGNDSILTVAHRLGDLGIDVAMSPTLRMSAWSTRGSSLAATVTLAASDCSGIDCNYEDEVINTVLLRTKQAWYEAPTAAPASDRWEGFLSFGELTSEAVARDIAEAVMNTYDDPREIVTFTWPTELGPQPYVDFNVGDYITAPGWATPAAQTIGGRATRILSIAAEETEAGTIEWTAEGEQ